MCDLISITHIVIHDVRQDLQGEKRTSQLSQLQLAHKTTYDVLRDATPHLLDALNVCDTATLMAEYATHNSYTNSVVELTISNDDNELIKPIISKMNTWLPRFTYHLWDHLDEKEEKKAINAALRIALQPKAMLAATIAVKDAIETEDPNEIPPTLLKAIRKKKIERQTDGCAQKTIAKKLFGGGQDQVLERHQEWSKIKKDLNSCCKKEEGSGNFKTRQKINVHQQDKGERRTHQGTQKKPSKKESRLSRRIKKRRQDKKRRRALSLTHADQVVSAYGVTLEGQFGVREEPILPL